MLTELGHNSKNMVNLFFLPEEIRKCHHKRGQNVRAGGRAYGEQRKKKRREEGVGGRRRREENASTELETNPVRIQLTFQCPQGKK